MSLFHAPSPELLRPHKRSDHSPKSLLRRHGWILGVVWFGACLGVLSVKGLPRANQAGVELAAPVVVSPAARTVAIRSAAERDFRARHYLGAYLDDAHRSGPMDPRGRDYIELWIEIFWGEPTVEQHERFRRLGRELLAEPAERHDVVLLQALANEMLVPADGDRLALSEKIVRQGAAGNPSPYARFCALAVLAMDMPQTSGRVRTLDDEGLVWLRRAIANGDLPSADQEILAENLLFLSWGGRLFRRRSADVHAVFAEAGENWRWLAALLEGEVHRRRAWDARGQGWANTVSDEGRRIFQTELALAERAFERAWTIDRSRPITAARLVAVNMGQADRVGLRRWFERGLAAQIDHPQTWRAYRQALTPRWLGSEEALLALADAALATGRFDSEAPRTVLATFDDYAKERGVREDHGIFGHEHIWPRVSRMFEGYLATDLSEAERARWRSDYARAAYAAGRPEVARAQLVAVNWRPVPPRMWEWKRDFSNLEVDVAARDPAR